jgi:Leucine-rich repeat (LRR) protein
MKKGFLIARFLLFVLLMIFCDFVSFGQQEEEKPTQQQLKTAEETERLMKSTNWDDPEEARKARIKLGSLFQQIDRESGVTTNEYPVDTTLQSPIVIGAEMAEQLTNEILNDFEMDEETGSITDEYYRETTILGIDLENPEPGFTLADLERFPNLQLLYLKGTKTGTEIDLGSLIGLLADKPITELYLVRNYAGTHMIPESIGKLSKLKKLALYGNQISSLPDSIQNLTGLEELYVDLNPIERLPDGINQLKNLKLLGIAKTGINENEKLRIQKSLPNCKILIK